MLAPLARWLLLLAQWLAPLARQQLARLAPLARWLAQRCRHQAGLQAVLTTVRTRSPHLPRARQLAAKAPGR